MRSDPRDVVAAIELSRATYRKMIQNLVWATGYNLIAIPVAAGVLVPWGIDLPMAVGAIAMSLSTIIVAANAQLLRGAPAGARRPWPLGAGLLSCAPGRASFFCPPSFLSLGVSFFCFFFVWRVALFFFLVGGRSGSRPTPDSSASPGRWNRIQIVVRDLAAEVERLRMAGLAFVSDIVTGPGGSQILLADPSGNLIELFEAAH